MEIKTDALMLRAVDYGENDKMATLLTAGYGKLGAAVKGVKKAAARLKFAAQPFCFAEYVLAEKNGRHTVVSASLHDGFYPLREDVCAYYAAAAVCEVCDRIAYEGMQTGSLLLLAVTALKEMTGEPPSGPLIRFLLGALAFAGYPIRAEGCALCGAALSGRMRFDMESGSFVCEACGKGTPASEVTYLTISAALSGGAPPTGEAGKEGEKRALRLLSSYLTYQTDAEFPALIEYIRMI